MDNQSLNSETSGSCPHDVFNAGCGCNEASGMVLTISPTTGGQFNLQVRKTDSIDHIKKIISKKLKVLKERICLLYREKQLIAGSLQENGLADGCRLVLLPMVETGLTPQKPEISVMNALESLNEAQVNDFLSGKAPLNLTMRLGDHMMLIQLMLSTFSNQNQMSIANTTKSENSASTSTHIPNTKGFQPGPVVLESAATRLEKILISRATNNDLTVKTSDLSTSNETLQKISSSSLSPDVQMKNSSKNCTSCPESACTCRVSSYATSVSYGVDSIPLATATRNLTQTLQKLSSEVLTSKFTPPMHSKFKNNNNNNINIINHNNNNNNNNNNTNNNNNNISNDNNINNNTTTTTTTTTSILQFNRKSNAILENMEHHGKGIYSGTFSGTLNPALQDRFGRPKKDVSTIIHILNDLLCAEPRSRCKASCNCSSASLLDKQTVPSSSSSSSSVIFSNAERPLNNVNEHTSCDTATVVPINVNKNHCSSFNKMNENQTTRSKMEQLKSMMGVRKEKRREKRFTPYDKRISAVDVISSSTVNSTEPWSTVDPSTSAETSDPASIHTKAVIA